MDNRGARWCSGAMAGPRTWSGPKTAGVSRAPCSKISHKAIARGFDQIGTLGSGNHYLEIQVVHPEYVYDAELLSSLALRCPSRSW